jgi:hypothetical protein
VNDPQSFHKYLYTHADPVNMVDPTGLWGAMAISIGIGMAIGGFTAWTMGGGTQEILFGAAAGGCVGFLVGLSYLSGLPLFSLGWKECIAYGTLILPLLIYATKELYAETQIGKEPTAAEKSRINEAIILIESKGGDYIKIAENLKKMTFSIDDVTIVKGWARQPQLSFSKIILTDTVTNPGLYDIEFLASTIIHEYTHACTILGFKATPRGEMWAWSAQSEFLKVCGVYGSVKNILDKYPNTNDEIVSEMADNFLKYHVHDRAIWH